MQIIDGTALSFTLPHSAADRLLSHIDRTALIGVSDTHKELAMFWGESELQNAAYLLDHLLPPHEVPRFPTLLERDYKWPGIFKPFSHQVDTAAFLSIRRRAFCFSEAGTGKTSAAIWAADYLMTRRAVARALVICPLSIMQSAWQGDLFNTAMHRSVAVAYGSADKRRKIVNDPYEFVIINYDGVETVFDDIRAQNFNLIIVDEASHYKNVSTKRWKTLSKLMTPDTWLWMMTGTPAAQSPLDAYGLAKLVSPIRVPKTAGAWKDMTMFQPSSNRRFTWLPKQDAKLTVFNALQPAIRFEKAQCLDLPEVTYQTREVPMSAQAAGYYRQLKKEMLIQAAGENVSAVNAGAALSKLLQIASGSAYTDDGNVLEFDMSPRLNALMEVLDETEHKVLVFCSYTHTIRRVSEFLASKHIPAEVIDGSVSATERFDRVKRFQSAQIPRVFILQPQAASHGLTLTRADTVVFWGPVMSVETYLQCIARIDRVGQVNSMTVIHLQGSDVERRMYGMLRQKVDSHIQLVDLYKQELELEEV